RIVPVAASSNGWWMKIAAIVILAIGLGSVFLFERKEKQTEPEQTFARFDLPKPKEQTPITPITRIKKRIIPTKRDNPGVVSTDLAYLDPDDQDTVNHLEQTQNLLRSIRNATTSDS